ncbi:MAG TPA: hypothetical protein VFF73_17855 [Planctomycetota bacterium]|nr:hypothetical protein [Planctomycetota bacterium]
MAVKRCVLFIAHVKGEGDFRSIVTHHLDLEPLHASSLTTRVKGLGTVVASVLLVEDEHGRKLLPARGEGLTDSEYKEFLASCEDWALGR